MAGRGKSYPPGTSTSTPAKGKPAPAKGKPAPAKGGKGDDEGGELPFPVKQGAKKPGPKKGK